MCEEFDMSESKDNFEKGIFWKLYLDLEHQFQNFLEYVPYLEGNEKTYSFKLLNLILSIGGHIDSAFKEMARYPKFSINSECRQILKLLQEKKVIPITLPLKAFDKEYGISNKIVIFKCLPEVLEVVPFKPRSKTAISPHWWKIYNGLKHDVGINLKEANLLNTLHALAGAFLLNVIHEPAILRFYQHRMFKYLYKQKDGTYQISKKAALEFPMSIIEYALEHKQSLPFMIETPLFIYEYEQ